MEPISKVLQGKRYYNVNVDKEIVNNVNVEELVQQVKDAVDKPKAIGEQFARELQAPQNVKLYISLFYKHPLPTLYECLALTKEAHREGKIKTTQAQYFYGIVRRHRMR